MSMMELWRGGNLAVIKSTNCKRDRRSSCSRERIPGSGDGCAGGSLGRGLFVELPNAGFFLDSAMPIKILLFRAFANECQRNNHKKNGATDCGGLRLSRMI